MTAPGVAPTYRPDVDGLRAVAVSSVIAFHAFPAALPGGFVGVDAFFVISGFLITGILLQGQDTGTFGFLDFYQRRVRRIFPALLVAVAATLALGWALLLPAEFAALGRHVAAGMAYVSNLQLWSEVDYFDVEAERKPLLHLWSLAVEEQFYAGWPLLLWLAARVRRTGALVAACAGASLALGVVATRVAPDAAFYLPFTRFWELLAGAGLAHASRYRPATLAALVRPGPAADLAGALGLALLVGPMVAFGRDTPFPGLAALAPVAGATLLVAAPGGRVNRLILAHPAAVAVGLVSYPAYLWHWPLLAFLHVAEVDEPRAVGLAVAATLALAWATTRFVEAPVRAQAPGRFFRGLFAASLGVLAVGLGAAAGALPPYARWPAARTIDAALSDWHMPPRDGVVGHLRRYRFPGTAPGEVVLAGDSNLEQWLPRLAAVADAPGDRLTAVAFAAGGCRPLPNVTKRSRGEACLRTIPTLRAHLAEHPARRLVLAGRWHPGLASEDLVHVGPDGVARPLTDPGARAAALDDLAAFVREVRAAGTEVVVLHNIPSEVRKLGGPTVDRFGLLRRGEAALGLEAWLAPFPAAEGLDPAGRAALEAVCAAAGCTTLDPIPALCPDGACRMVDDGIVVYKDLAHVTSTWARERGSWLDPLLAP